MKTATLTVELYSEIVKALDAYEPHRRRHHDDYRSRLTEDHVELLIASVGLQEEGEPADEDDDGDDGDEDSDRDHSDYESVWKHAKSMRSRDRSIEEACKDSWCAVDKLLKQVGGGDLDEQTPSNAIVLHGGRFYFRIYDEGSGSNLFNNDSSFALGDVIALDRGGKAGLGIGVVFEALSRTILHPEFAAALAAHEAIRAGRERAMAEARRLYILGRDQVRPSATSIGIDSMDIPDWRDEAEDYYTASFLPAARACEDSWDTVLPLFPEGVAAVAFGGRLYIKIWRRDETGCDPSFPSESVFILDRDGRGLMCPALR